MDVGLGLGIASAVGTFAAFVVSVVVYRRQFPKRQLRYALSIAPLTAPSHKDFELRYRGETVTTPHLATIWIRSASRVDIPSAAFDAGKSIVFRINDRVVGTSSDSQQDIAWELQESELRIPPQLIHPRARLEVSLVIDGRPETYDVESPLIDIALNESMVLVPSGSRALTALIVSASAMVVVVVTLLVIAVSTNVL